MSNTLKIKLPKPIKAIAKMIITPIIKDLHLTRAPCLVTKPVSIFTYKVNPSSTTMFWPLT